MGIETVDDGTNEGGSAVSPEYVIIGTDSFSINADSSIVVNEAASGRYLTLPTEHFTLAGQVSGTPTWITKANGSSPVVVHGPGVFVVEAWPQSTISDTATDFVRFTVGQNILNMPGNSVTYPVFSGSAEMNNSSKLGPFVLAAGEILTPALFLEITDGVGDLGTGDFTPWVVITKLS